jgi:protein-tyrosine phosphatase
MAAGVLARALEAEGGRVEVSSAGTHAHEGDPATPPTLDIASREGIDLAAHRSRRIGPERVRAADLVLVMEREHLAPVLALGADPARTHVLSEWPEPGDPGLPISDPFGASREAYEECWRRIRLHLNRVVPHVREALRARSR